MLCLLGIELLSWEWLSSNIPSLWLVKFACHLFTQPIFTAWRAIEQPDILFEDPINLQDVPDQRKSIVGQIWDLESLIIFIYSFNLRSSVSYLLASLASHRRLSYRELVNWKKNRCETCLIPHLQYFWPWAWSGKSGSCLLLDGRL